MTVQAAIDEALPTLRAEATARMTSLALVESVAVSTDRVTGGDIETVTVVYEALPCRVKAPTRSANLADVQGATTTVYTLELHVPWDTTGLTEGLRVTVAASRNPALVGNTYRLTDPGEGDQITAQRWGVESWARRTL